MTWSIQKTADSNFFAVPKSDTISAKQIREKRRCFLHLSLYEDLVIIIYNYSSVLHLRNLEHLRESVRHIFLVNTYC